MTHSKKKMKVVPVYFDWRNDEWCDMTEYRFHEQDIAEAFRHEAVFVHDMIYVCPLYEKDMIDGKRPIFQNVQEAMDDLKRFVHDSQYPFYEEIKQVPLLSLHVLIFRSECAYLEDENRELRRRLARYEENNKNNGN